MSDLKTMTGLAFKPVTDMHRDTPPAKLRVKYLKSVAGGVVFVGGFFIPKFLGFPWPVGAVVSCFGAFIVSQEVVTRFIKIIPAAVAALKGAKVS